MKENIKKAVSDLINRFHRNKEIYKNPKYNETQLRREFLDPFFSALGWDVENKQGFAEQYKEVVHEDAIKISGATKAPDYSFRIGGMRKFFVEAKKPAVDIKYDIHPSYQLRRYAWSAKLPISILTDFEEFSVYDCRIKPNQNDKASVACIYYQTYDKYLKDLEFINSTFSKEAILKGSFDKYISSTAKKRGTSEVDKEFLKEIERWRDILARNIALRNKNLSIFELNFLVQLTIDRIIFLRIAEDRGVEDYRNLYKLAEKKHIYRNLFHLFKIADDKYNSGIFDFQKDKISPNINIDDKVLKSILMYLYYPESPYEFSVLPADILGNIYEQFLGKTIRLTPSHYAKVEEKPEVRKAGGVYYTPKYIVDYIVKNTVGKKIKGKTPRQISKITICDPACGSGSFLIQAYQYLLNYHLEFYQKDPKKYRDKIIQISEDSYQLTTQEKKRILLNNIYGVDIDPQAVEVTKLSLLLKVLQGENKETLGKTLQLFHERALPNLSNNIKCGNSLIGTDYYDNVDMPLFGNEKMRKINAFDWEKEFPQIFKPQNKKHQHKIPLNKGGKLSEAKQGDVIGFDVVIGNPPYVLLQNMENKTVFEYTYKRYESAIYKIDTYQLFIEHSIKLLKNNGFFGYITPNTYLKNIHSEPLRKFILNTTEIKDILLLHYSVFPSASVDVCISIFKKVKSPSSNNLIIISESKEAFYPEKIRTIKQSTFCQDEHYLFNIALDQEANLLINKIKRGAEKLETYCKAYFGIQTFDRKKYVSNSQIDKTYKPVVDGKNIEKYYLRPYQEFVKFISSAIKSGGNENVYKQKRIGIRQIGTVPIATIIPDNIFALNTIYNIYIKPNIEYSLYYFLGIINSKLIEYYWLKSHFDEKRIFPKIKKKAILSIPIRRIDFSNPSEKKLHDTLVSLVEQMLSAQKQFHSAKIERDKKLFKQKIDILDRKIDKLVYELYGLSKEEIRIVESSE
ncbi:MAG: N-6 DNA methylase [Candidatus Cloacimonadota bacterium]|nr:N-6 DNA methylase [Candidatus Cloacimonadota bacterium]